ANPAGWGGLDRLRQLWRHRYRDDTRLAAPILLLRELQPTTAVLEMLSAERDGVAPSCRHGEHQFEGEALACAKWVMGAVLRDLLGLPSPMPLALHDLRLPDAFARIDLDELHAHGPSEERAKRQQSRVLRALGRGLF